MRDGWSRASVAEVALLVKRGRAPSYVDDGVLVLGQRCVRGGRVETEHGRRTDVRARPVPNWAYLMPGDSLVNSTGVGALGRVGYFGSGTEPTTVDSHVTIVRPDPRVVAPAYLSLALYAKESELVRLQSGSTNQTELSPSALGAVEIDLPSLAEQRRIVDLIGAVDEGSAATQEAAAAYIRMGQELVAHEWYEAGSQRTPVATLAGMDFGRRLKDGDWIESKDQSPRMDDAIRLLQLADLGVGEFLDRSDRWISPETFRRLRCTAVLPGDLLISRMADPAGRTARVPTWDYGMVTAVDCTILRLDPTIADADYWLAMLNSREWFAEVDRLATGSTRRRVTRRNLERVLVPLVPIERQRLIGALLAAVAEGAAAARTVTGDLRALRAALLADLLSGEHEIPAAYDRLLDGAA